VHSFGSTIFSHAISGLNNLPGIVFLAKENEKIIGVLRMKSCIGKVNDDPDVFEDENDISCRKAVWFKKWAKQQNIDRGQSS
jgi:hypothetical protein